MPSYEVMVQWSDGSKASNQRVVVETTNGMSRPAHTDKGGRAVVEASGYPKTLFVAGKDCGKPRTGTNHVTLR